jgi:hypothetical protein
LSWREEPVDLGRGSGFFHAEARQIFSHGN